VLLLKRLHVREKETLPLKLQKEVQLQGEESALPLVRKAALREKLLREKLPLREAALREKLLREKAALREKHLREKVALREKHLREKALLRNEKDKQSLTLKAPFLFF
jgi:hypothetical protein